jgi:hypothetical protein
MGVIDGDFVEKFLDLKPEMQKKILSQGDSFDENEQKFVYEVLEKMARVH